jgi:hypothetical protein
MAKTYAAIQTITVSGSSTSAITFSNIPQNFIDLKIVGSARSTSTTGNWVEFTTALNGLTTNMSTRELYNNTTNGNAATDFGSSIMWSGYATNANNTANTFGLFETVFTNYSTSYYKSMTSVNITENNAASASLILLSSGLWQSTAAINSITLTLGSGNLVAGSTFTLYGIGLGTKATGGSIFSDGKYIYHAYTSAGSFTATEQIKNAEVMVVAGGGGSGGWSSGGGTGGGGGGGGVAYTNALTINAGTTYSAIIGAGGSAGSSGANGTNGINSTFGVVTAYGGGYGASHFSGNTSGGGAGGSGGGASEWAGAHPAGAATQTTVGAIIGYGYPGGASNGTGITSGGGGGAGQAGQDGGTTYNGYGGVGTTAFSNWLATTGMGVYISGTGYYMVAGGGGAGGNNTYPTPGLGGQGGGGVGTYSSTGTAGTTNTGGGAGGGHGSGAAGGSGLIIVRYPITN